MTKLSKSKVWIVVSFLCIFTIVLSLCSFSPPSFRSTTPTVFSSFTLYDVENLMSVANVQNALGSFTSLFPVYCRWRGTGVLELVLLQSGSSYSFTEDSSGNWTFSSSGMALSASFTSDGFTLISEGVGNTSTDRLLFYRPDASSPLIVNSSFNFSTGNNNDDIADIAAYWYEFYSNVINYESDIQSSYNNGFNVGFSEGESSGYRNGYDEGQDFGYHIGYDEGESFGYRNGYDEGQDFGYDFGFGAGYDTGYDSGFNDGLASAEPGEVVTQIIYRDAVSLDVQKFISGIGSVPKSIIDTSFDINIFGLNIAGILGAFIVVVVVVFVVNRLKT